MRLSPILLASLGLLTSTYHGQVLAKPTNDIRHHHASRPPLIHNIFKPPTTVTDKLDKAYSNLGIPTQLMCLLYRRAYLKLANEMGVAQTSKIPPDGVSPRCLLPASKPIDAQRKIEKERAMEAVAQCIPAYAKRLDIIERHLELAQEEFLCSHLDKHLNIYYSMIEKRLHFLTTGYPYSNIHPEYTPGLARAIKVVIDYQRIQSHLFTFRLRLSRDALLNILTAPLHIRFITIAQGLPKGHRSMIELTGDDRMVDLDTDVYTMVKSGDIAAFWGKHGDLRDHYNKFMAIFDYFGVLQPSYGKVSPGRLPIDLFAVATRYALLMSQKGFGSDLTEH
ncbi:hypothetical protein BJ684DRAFT_15721 [Piptocephalis cylindrospora]|uniref:Uncharacterized protein n=1 Tax=Piptocephalis cylindrospora TaxID=1907219 RepID=A0A4P9Y4V4_9FUNG|nr:hypothetical protein BJ684DRAFT_15721 [Piptocephalis cylindrospora]|eukprot:RKP13923.1 hypothetical protein BJ684DRAFT_15721 [Piptocephalis cylindrospora]